MPAKKAKPQTVQEPRITNSPDVVLAYEGGRTPRYVPARDLDGSDLARIAYRRAIAEERGSRSRLVAPGEKRTPVTRPAQADSDTLEAIASELAASGAFRPLDPPADAPAQPQGA